MLKDDLGKDKFDRKWSVQVDIIPPEQDPYLQFTNVDFYVCSPSRKVVKDSSDYIGDAHLTIQESSKTVAKIEDIKIDPPYRGRRIGSLLLDYVERWALQNNIKTLYGDLVKVDRGHISVLKGFYDKHGFTFTIFNKPSSDRTALGKIEKPIV